VYSGLESVGFAPVAGDFRYSALAAGAEEVGTPLLGPGLQVPRRACTAQRHLGSVAACLR